MVKPKAPSWLWRTSISLCLVGLAVDVYLTLVEYARSAVPLACARGGLLDCQRVLFSPESRLAGIPLSDLGVVFFVVMLLLCLPNAWRTQMTAIHQARVAGTWISMPMVVYLLYTELFELRAVCLYCTAIHVLAFLLFVVVVVGSQLRRASLRAYA
jgi:uncharacterized membrane protein